jgi:RNA polymerase sigma factor (sigma-70 family)
MPGVSPSQSPNGPHHANAEERKVLFFHPEHLDDTALWTAFRKGDEKALVSIFDRFTRLLYNYGYKIVGEEEVVKDAIQDLFIELWKNREHLGDTTSIKFYLFKSLRRKLIRISTKNRRSIMVRFHPGHEQESLPSPEFLLIAEQTSIEDREKIMKLLNTLTKRQREAIFLRYFEELSYDKIAAIMEMSKQAVYNLVSKSIEQLKNALILFVCFGLLL